MNDCSSSDLSRGSRLCTRRGAALTNTGNETWQRFILKFVFFEALPQCCPVLRRSLADMPRALEDAF